MSVFRIQLHAAILVGMLSLLPRIAIGEAPQLGVDVALAGGTLRVVRVAEGRTIADRLQAGDILYGYVILDTTSDEVGPVRSINSDQDIEQIERLLLDGHTVELVIHRSVPGIGLMELTVHLVAGDLELEADVSTESVRVPIPVAKDAGEFEMTFKEVPPAALETVEVPYSSEPIGQTKDWRTGIIKTAIYYATNRKLVDGQYGGQRNTEPNPFGGITEKPLRYGICFVTIPPTHKPGQVEGPRWRRFEFSEDPAKHIVLQTVSEIGRDGFLTSVKSQFEAHPVDRKQMLVFVHGFNVSFADAARRTAQLTYDLEFSGLGSLFSWPSDGSVLSYSSDEDDNAYSIGSFVEYLQTLNSSPDIDDVYIIAHSMGCRLTCQSLIALAAKNDGGKIREVVLAAPDIDANRFQTEYAEKLVRAYPRVTIYASSEDKALFSSNVKHSTDRLGQIIRGVPTIAVRKGIDVIDASLVRTSFLEHGAFGDTSSMIGDIFRLITRPNVAPNVRSTYIQAASSPGAPLPWYRVMP